MKPKNAPLPIYQGTTLVKQFNWYGGGKVCTSIDGVTIGCPTIISCLSHGMATGKTPIEIHGVQGARDLNQETIALYIDADSFSVPIDTGGKTYDADTGSVSYHAVKDLSGYTARMHIRELIDDATTIVELTSAAGDIGIVVETALITITIAADVTAAFDFEEAVYDLELISGTNVVTRLVEGDVTLIKEVTR
jgi:hypothetical protein